MDKKYWHYIWITRIRPIKITYLIALTLMSGIIWAGAMRHNNQVMGQHREEVYSADKNDGNVVLALQNLQKHVTSHMNTNLVRSDNPVYPPIQLQYTYQRLQDAAKQKAATANAALYSQAQAYCERANATDFSGRNRVPCIEKYVSENGGAKPTPIPDSMYKFNFASPRWSPDLAGFSLIIAILFAALTILRFVVGWALKRFTK